VVAASAGCSFSPFDREVWCGPIGIAPAPEAPPALASMGNSAAAGGAYPPSELCGGCPGDWGGEAAGRLMLSQPKSSSSTTSFTPPPPPTPPAALLSAPLLFSLELLQLLVLL